MKGNPFIRRPMAAFAISILIIIVGIISLLNLPIEQYPDIAPPTVMVSTSYPGADADAVMNSVIVPLEESINGVENMMYMRSTATNSGSGSITVYFEQGTDPDMAAINVQNRVSMAQGLLPSEVVQIGVTTLKRQTSMLQIDALWCPDGRYDESFISNYLDINVIPEIKRVNGVGDVMEMGDTYSMRIWLNPERMAQYGLVPSDITAVLNEQNLEAPTGSLGENSGNVFQYTMKYSGRLESMSEFENIVVRANSDGSVLRLKDIAEVELGRESYSFHGEIDGKPGVTMMVFQVAGSNATEVNAAVSAKIEELSEELPAGLEFVQLQSTNDFLFASIHNVVETLIIAIILVILVVYFFLHDFRSTIIPSLSIIVSLVGTFACLAVAGFSVNILTLFALVLAIGIVVDDAIIVVEAVQARFDSGYKSTYLAVRDGMHDVSTAIITCSIVFMAVFIPGDGRRKTLNSAVKAAYEASFGAIMGKYKKGIMYCIHHRWLVWGSLGASAVLLVVLMGNTKTGLVPQEDMGTIMVNVGTSPGNTLVETNKVMEQIKGILVEQPEIEHYSTIAGYGMIAGQGTSYGTVIIKLRNWDDRKGREHSSDAVMARLNARFSEIKEASIFCFQPGMIPGYGLGNSLDLNVQDMTGGDINTLYDNVMRFISALNERPEIAQAYTTFSLDFPQIALDIDAAKCKRAGLAVTDVLNVIGAYCGGSYVSNYNQFGKVYRVMLQAAPEYRLDKHALDNIFVRNGSEMAPVSQFVTLENVMGPQVSNRFNLYNSIAVNVNPADGYSTGQAQQAVSEVAAQVLPVGYSFEYGGIAREEASSSGSQTAFVYAICVILIYLIMVCLYESFLLPLAVIFSVPFGLVGSFLFANLFGLENNIYLQTGMIMLIGLLTKTAILITEYAVERRRRGMGIMVSAFSAAKARLRPILMTVFCMIFGMLPLMFSSGAGANGNGSLATGVIGGMLVGTVSLLFFTPVFYTVFEYLQEKLRRKDVYAEDEQAES